MKNMITGKEKEEQICHSKSFILTPYNSNARSDDSVFFPEISIQNEIWTFGDQVNNSM